MGGLITMLSPSVPEFPRVLIGEKATAIIARLQKNNSLDFTSLWINFAELPLRLMGWVE